jgi:hypothetical protein
MSPRRKPKTSGPNTFIGIADFLFSLNNVIFLLFVFALLSMAAKLPPNAGVELKADYLITAEWDLAHDCDVDLWVRDPLGRIVFFATREAGSMHLDHDSMGHVSDEERLSDGQVVRPHNYTEVVTLRGIVPGEYAVNLHLYGAFIGGSQIMEHRPGTPFSVPVHVRITRINPRVETTFDETPTLERVWQELTVTRFTLAADGTWLGSDKTPMSLQQR